MPEGNDQWIQKATTTSAQLNSEGGYLNPAQASQFIRQIFDETVLLREIRREIMNAPQVDIDKMVVREGIMRVVDTSNENEDQEPYSKAPKFSKITLNAQKLSLPFIISEDALEDNIEGAGLEQTVINHFTEQGGLDLENYALNSDDITPTPTTLDAAYAIGAATISVVDSSTFPEDSTAGYLRNDTTGELMGYGFNNVAANDFENVIKGTGPDPDNIPVADSASAGAADPISWSPHPLKGYNKGYITLAQQGAATLIDGSGIDAGALTNKQFFEMWRQMPDEYKRGGAKNRLKWVLSTTQMINWHEFLGQRDADSGYNVLMGREMAPIGIGMIAANSMRDSKIMLTIPRNLIFGIHRRVRIRKAADDSKAIMQDLRFYNMTTRADMQIERSDAVVLNEFLTGVAGS